MFEHMTVLITQDDLTFGLDYDNGDAFWEEKENKFRDLAIKYIGQEELVELIDNYQKEIGLEYGVEGEGFIGILIDGNELIKLKRSQTSSIKLKFYDIKRIVVGIYDGNDYTEYKDSNTNEPLSIPLDQAILDNSYGLGTDRWQPK